ncbi:hypothetical protein ABZ532_19155 [Streptomyces sp. NPDC019396]|uniref:hypothetical protein n=1 Tax=Streptomyces sp. NPDC019396 TaxID=3154687 RepID=UPI00340C36F1
MWTETLRNERLSRMLDGAFADMRGAWVRLVDAYRDSGFLHADVPSEDLAQTLMATAQGFIAQKALLGDADVKVLENGLRGLMSMQPPKIS